MAWYRIDENVLDAIANAINAKTGHTAPMTPVEMVLEIQSIQTGGGSVEVTIVNGVNAASLTTIMNAISSASGFTDWVTENKSTAPDSGAWLYSGVCLPSITGNLINTYRRTSDGSVGYSTWNANGNVPAGTKFNVWGVATNA